jgi:sugar transferase (PEP-CTERM/EpsH1 system associated)
MSAPDSRLLVAHVVYRFDVGGLENGVVNLVNSLPSERFRHAIVALTEVTEFRHRILRDDVRYVSLRKTPGHGVRQWPALVRAFRELRPDIVHTRNLAPLEATLPAWLAGVPARVHGEHGWDVGDLDGSNSRHRLTRRLYRPFVTRYVALSRHIQEYLQSSIGVPADAIAQIYNGVDTARYSRAAGTRAPIVGSPFSDSGAWLIGTVGRLAAVKHQAGLITAVAAACRASAAARERLRLVIVGDGPLMGELKDFARAEGVADRTWFAGARDDVEQLLAGLDAFALPSLAEGISNTLLEAMSTGLPVVATRVGGNTELVTHDVNGMLVPSGDPAALTNAMLGYLTDPALARRHGVAARATVEARFSLDRMVADYTALYEAVARRRVATESPNPTSTRPAQARGNN